MLHSVVRDNRDGRLLDLGPQLAHRRFPLDDLLGQPQAPVQQAGGRVSGTGITTDMYPAGEIVAGIQVAPPSSVRAPLTAASVGSL